jgi:hypothetical protein
VIKSIVIGDKRYRWRDILKLRREQAKAEHKPQPTLFPLKEDSRPPSQKTADGRHSEPTLFE